MEMDDVDAPTVPAVAISQDPTGGQYFSVGLVRCTRPISLMPTEKNNKIL